MIKKFEIQGVHAEVDDKLKAYVKRKIGGLDKYINKHNRESAHCEVHLKETQAKGKDKFRCEVTMHMPQKTIVVKESALNFYAAVDIAEVKIKQQLQKYKDLHGNGKKYRHVFARLKRKSK